MCWLEQYDSINLECDVWKIFLVKPISAKEQGSSVFGDFHGQFFEDKWTFCALTNIGICAFPFNLLPPTSFYNLFLINNNHLRTYLNVLYAGFQFFDVLRPLDQLQELVATYGDQLKDNYSCFINTYGMKETLAMLLELASSNSYVQTLKASLYFPKFV